ncbi:MAG: rRNA maturation RNase YbeY [Magnetococcus sp. MYC-9]
MPKIHINRDCTLWPRIEKTVRRAVKAALADCTRTRSLEVGVLLTEDAEIRHMNRLYRHRDQATNVLSFAMEEGEELPRKGKKQRLLGDIVLAYETVDREAAARQIPLEWHVTHLVVHGVLHLRGYDHERSPAEAQRQESREIAILANLGLPDPYEMP